MAGTYSQVNIHSVFAVKGRENLIAQEWRNRLHVYLRGILENEKIFPLAVGGWLDHVHIFYELPMTKDISSITRVLKSNSSKWINENDFVRQKFSWQEGYGAFSHSRAQRDTLIKYIINQEQHHRKQSFKHEYVEVLKRYDILYEPKFLFEFYG